MPTWPMILCDGPTSRSAPSWRPAWSAKEKAGRIRKQGTPIARTGPWSEFPHEISGPWWRPNAGPARDQNKSTPLILGIGQGTTHATSSAPPTPCQERPGLGRARTELASCLVELPEGSKRATSARWRTNRLGLRHGCHQRCLPVARKDRSGRSAADRPSSVASGQRSPRRG